MKILSIGSDPEIFLEDAKGKIISAIGRIGGTKDKPKQVKELPKGFTIQEDNVLLEYNTPPARTASTWNNQHAMMRQYLVEMVGKQGLKLSTKASHSMDEDQVQHPKAFVFGCDPDYNVWKMKWNPKPQCSDPLLRSAGGHIHVGYENPTAADSIRIGRMLDYWVGAPLSMVDPDKRRRELYGKPGAIRFKPYGLEYRTPSNWWIHNDHAVASIFYNVHEAVQCAHQIDSWGKMLDAARRFMEGEIDSYDMEWFNVRGATYVENGKQKKSPKKNPASLGPEVESFFATTGATVNTWTSISAGQMSPVFLDEEGDEDQP